jgi:hypothetical protein
VRPLVPDIGAGGTVRFMSALGEDLSDRSTPEPVRLLIEIPSTSHGDLIVRYPYQNDSDYAFAYHEAAKRLASTFRGAPIDDTILLPFLMLYRHAFELRLKHLIRYLAETRRRYQEPGNKDISRKSVEKRLRHEHGHQLRPLLEELLVHLKALDLDSDFPPDVVSTISLLHEADSTGMAFRYAQQLPDTQERTNFLALAALLDEQLNMLTVTEDYVDGLFADAPDDYMH